MSLFPVLIIVLVASVFYHENKSQTTKAQSLYNLTRLPVQPGTFVYGDTSDVPQAWKKKGALVIVGRVNYNRQSVKDVSAAGGHVLIYIDSVLSLSHGRYHTMLHETSECGPKAGVWPNGRILNSYGPIADIRVGSVLQSKLECVLEKMVSENPHMAGFFADDLGSRTYGSSNWTNWPDSEKQSFRNGAIDLVKTFRKVADKHGLFLMVNGVWSGGTVSSTGGGYPDVSKHGNSLADGFYVEHHDRNSFWDSVLASSQWASGSATTHGNAFHFATPATQSATALGSWADSPNLGWSNITTKLNSGDSYYKDADAVWASFHATGLPSEVDAGVPSTPPPPPPQPAPQPSPDPSPSPSPSPSLPTNSENPPPVIEVPGASTTDPVDIPDGLAEENDGSFIADFTGDGLNEIAKDTNNDGKIDPTLEIVVDGSENAGLTNTNLTPVTITDQKAKTESTITFKPGPLPEVRIAKPVAYTFFIAQSVAITGIGTYLMLTKLSMFAGVRGKWGL